MFKCWANIRVDIELLLVDLFECYANIRVDIVTCYWLICLNVMLIFGLI